MEINIKVVPILGPSPTALQSRGWTSVSLTLTASGQTPVVLMAALGDVAILSYPDFAFIKCFGAHLGGLKKLFCVPPEKNDPLSDKFVTRDRKCQPFIYSWKHRDEEGKNNWH